MDESEEGRDDARDADPAGEDSDTIPDADTHEENGASPDSESPFAFDQSLPDSPDDDTDSENGPSDTDADTGSESDPADTETDTDAAESGGGLTRVDPPDDPPRPDKPPRPSGGEDGSAGGLRRIDDADDTSPSTGEAGDGDGDGEDPPATGHGAHPAERHDPVTGVGGTPPAGHAAGAPTPGEDSDPDADADSGDAPESVANAGSPAPVPSTGEADDGDDGTTQAAPGSTAHAEAAAEMADDVGQPSPAELGAAPAGTPSDPAPDFGDDGPPDDEEMPLSAHVEEMIRRLAVVVIAAGLATAFTFPIATRLINAMWYGVLPANVPPPTLYGPLEKLLAEIKVASLGGILIALPVVVYETYLFMRPGLYPKERRYFLAAVPTSLVLGSIGMAFAYFLVLPLLFRYFITYSESAVDALPFGLQVTFDLIVSLLGAFALVFQIPLLIMLAVMIGVVTRRWLERQRLLFWGLFVGIGFFISLGDATGTAPLIIGATMIGLFEGTLALLRWTGRN